MTDNIKKESYECQCCYSESSIFIEHGCQHLICLDCQIKMMYTSNRRSCLYCDPLNDSIDTFSIDMNTNVNINTSTNMNTNANMYRNKNILDCNSCCIIYSSLAVCVSFLLILLFIRNIDKI